MGGKDQAKEEGEDSQAVRDTAACTLPAWWVIDAYHEKFWMLTPSLEWSAVTQRERELKLAESIIQQKVTLVSTGNTTLTFLS